MFVIYLLGIILRADDNESFQRLRVRMLVIFFRLGIIIACNIIEKQKLKQFRSSDCKLKLMYSFDLFIFKHTRI